MNNEHCLAKILKVINVLQNNAERNDCDANNSCTRPFLGDIPSIICFNTRLVTFYRCDNSLVTLPYTFNGTDGTTTIFRVECVNKDSVNVRLILDNGDGTYTNTNNFATINLGCICAIRCIGDIDLEGI